MENVRNKIFNNALALATIVQQRKAQGHKVVFTNGCFDLIHTGHTRYLEQARVAGDCLIIGVNSDESVSRLKGDKRPIVTLEERMEVLAGLYFVDYLISFNEMDPYNLIKILRPSTLVKGGDWTVDDIIGKDIIETDGGSVFTIPEIPGQSTTGIINRIIDLYKPTTT
ncbi:MAG: D-glycero-beta-D-manno-heptose 1-phosphate adenylyltransferase [Deltaproteobacteria bacterium]|jgi:rfaE bifunctional protein nucleotidyltransferase chain/domain|nr:D-glycero-beta-D-manno-heptose 1-phosphate adenylyltransferase [Deltaproteobacteria bacterium]MBT4092276.1 D-glycero-beta-D-manno-heptose 1-phosphate adenylyltransferase [Deltaproteobacteria bacterium]MBT4266268.1 D-glycero-beta-D-manno-heptose 1-phosphate adenylyltransferase [Deltaproteobacteria bacterium]MBT4639979.1 D-glycero-beta-D-manno-heptose 1-phosphate adenylyltransferase [Deltaproteobacteria bacterium]MBT6503811.1 D-glycero-beta-D-manno-heptose 1-phosphate adenylyltransferase [Delt